MPPIVTIGIERKKVFLLKSPPYWRINLSDHEGKCWWFLWFLSVSPLTGYDEASETTVIWIVMATSRGNNGSREKLSMMLRLVAGLILFEVIICVFYPLNSMIIIHHYSRLLLITTYMTLSFYVYLKLGFHTPNISVSEKVMRGTILHCSTAHYYMSINILSYGIFYLMYKIE